MSSEWAKHLVVSTQCRALGARSIEVRSFAAVRHGLATTTCGSGRPVLLVHGFAGFKESWGAVPTAIAATGRTAVAVDLPGWGESPAPRRAPHTAPWYASRLAPLLDDLGPTVVVGHSLGCQAAVQVAVRRPDLVHGLVLVSPQVVRRAQTGWRPRVPSDWAALPLIGPLAIRLLVGVLARDDARLVRGFTVTVADPTRWRDDADALALLAEATRRFRATNARVWSMALHRGLRTDLRRTAGGLRVPTTILTGSRDRITKPPTAELLAASIPGARLVRLAGVGHLPQLEAPDVVVDAIAGIGSHPPRPRAGLSRARPVAPTRPPPAG